MTWTHPPRYPWDGFPDVLMHAEEHRVKSHPDYRAAKSGDAVAAARLIAATLNPVAVEQLSRYARDAPMLVSAHAYETNGVNAIPEARADELGNRLDWPVEPNIVQINVVGHTGADGFTRLARQAAFDGDVNPGTAYIPGGRLRGPGRHARQSARPCAGRRRSRARRDRVDRQGIFRETCPGRYSTG
jgi:hypothetical protein